MPPVRYILGLDPGANGSICALGSDKSLAFIDYTENTLELATWLAQYPPTQVKMAMIENVHSIFGTSAKSNFIFGFNTGILHGLLRGLGYSLDLVQPKIWQKELGVTAKGKDIKKDVASIVTRLYPSCDIYTPRKRLLDGRSDAAAVAHYTSLKYPF